MFALPQPSFPVATDLGPKWVRLTLPGFDALEGARVIKQKAARLALWYFQCPSFVKLNKIRLAKPADVSSKVSGDAFLIIIREKHEPWRPTASAALCTFESELAQGAGSSVRVVVLWMPAESPIEVTCSNTRPARTT